MAKEPAITDVDVKSLRNYAVKYARELFTAMFFGFRSAQLLNAHVGVKGKLVMTELQFIDDLARRYNCNPENLHTVAKLIPHELEVITSSIDGEFCPKKLESSYLGDLYQKGQNPSKFPYQKVMFAKFLQKLQQELEFAVWRAKKTDTPTPNDYLRQLFDGIIEQFKTAQAAGNASVYASGAISKSNIVETLENMYSLLDSQVKAAGVNIFMSLDNRDDYVAAKTAGNYKLDFIPVPGAKGYASVTYERGGGLTMIHAVPGLDGTDAIIITPNDNLVYMTDSPKDYAELNFREQKRTIEFWRDFNLGSGIALTGKGVLVGNDPILAL